MPSIEAVEQFKTIVQGLAGEPQIRAQLGLPAEEILPPESQVDDDLADLLGSMPREDSDETRDNELIDETEDLGPTSGGDLEDLFSTEVPEHDEEPVGPSLDDLLGPRSEDLAPPGLTDPFDFELDQPAESAAEELSEEDLAPSDDFGIAEESPEPFAEPAMADFGDDPFASTDDPFLDTPQEFSQPSTPKKSNSGVSPEDMDDAFFETPGADLFGTGPAATQEDDFDFGEPMGDADFPELAGFADTKEEDVEAFDALGEADEFQLGDFESQFGITADDHTDVEVLNPAQTIDLDVESAQKSLSLSDDEFKTIQRALGVLPLNLRLAVEELIGVKEVVFEDLDKVVKMLLARAPARSLATVVGRILGKKIIIPAGFEKGSGAELEARHGTLWYNLRTIMLPVLRVAALVTVVASVLILLGWNFLLRPWKANDLYDRGLVAVRQNDGSMADDLFAQAWYYWPVQDRFFQYAEAYQDSGDYDRARRKYLELLRPSVKAYKDEDKARLVEMYGAPLGPLPEGLEGQALADRLKAKKSALQAYYAYVVDLLSSAGLGTEATEIIPGEVVLGNPDTRGILEYSRFETDFGFDGLNKEAHFRRAEAILKPLLSANPGNRDGLLRRSDNYLAWSEAMSSRESLDSANSSLSEYLRLYGFDAPVTWRFVRVFLLEDEETELLHLRDQIDADKKLAIDGETMALLAKWLLDRDEAAAKERRTLAPKQNTIEDEYGIRPKIIPPPEEVLPEETTAHGAPAAPAAPAASHSLARSEGGGHGGGGGEGGGEGAKVELLKPPFKYPYSTQPFRADYLDKVDTLLLRAMDNQKALPELHYQLARFYRSTSKIADERRALAAADTYFQRLEPRKSRLAGRPAMKVATSNRIGEVFDSMGEPLQAEKYYLDAQKAFESYRSQGLMTLDSDAARIYRNLGNLYYRQTPGGVAAGSGLVPGGWEQALKLFRTSEQGQSSDPPVVYRIGVIEFEKKDFGAAVKQFFSLDKTGNLGEASGRSNPNLLYAMGNALFRSGNYASAEGYYRELLVQLQERRARIPDWDPAVRATHKALAQRTYQAWNNLAAAQYRASNAFRAGTPEFREAIAVLTTARAQSQILGRDLYESQTELDVTRVTGETLNAIRSNEAEIIEKTRKEKGLVEANLEVLSMIEVAPPSRKEALAQRLEIFARIPLELDQAEAP